MKKTAFLIIFIFSLVIPVLAKPGISLAQKEVYPGQSLSIILETDEEVKDAYVSLLGKYYALYPLEKKGYFRSIVPIPLEIEPGYYQVYVIYNISNIGGTIKQAERFHILKDKYPAIRLSFVPQKQKLLKPVLVNNDWDIIGAAVQQKNEKQLWSGEFILPCQGYFTSPFGEKRTIGKNTSWHRGLDIGSALKEKTKIIATNSGQVVLARYFKVFGNTVVIDHGQGIFSLYFHMSKILAQEGQEIKKGEILGKMGTTGVSTAPHLHWGMSVQDVRVDPKQWLDEAFFAHVNFLAGLPAGQAGKE